MRISFKRWLRKSSKNSPTRRTQSTETERTFYHIAVEQKDEKMYEFLKRNVERDGMVEALDNEGNTILHLATKKGNSPRVLLGHLKV